jgi:hypothetical protein
VPEVLTAPDQLIPFAPPPLAAQLVAAVEDHVSVNDSPVLTETVCGDRDAVSA